MVTSTVPAEPMRRSSRNIVKAPAAKSATFAALPPQLPQPAQQQSRSQAVIQTANRPLQDILDDLHDKASKRAGTVVEAHGPSTASATISNPINASTSAKPPHEFRYICPIEDCAHSTNREAATRADCKSHNPNLIAVLKVPYLTWLSGETKSPPSEYALKHYRHLLVNQNVIATKPATEKRKQQGKQTELTETQDEVPNPSRKRQRLVDFLEKQRKELFEFVEKEIGEAEERADEAERELASLKAEYRTRGWMDDNGEP